jgi:hypothetical protein
MARALDVKVAHEYKLHDGQNGSFGTLALAGEAVSLLCDPSCELAYLS